MLPVDAQRPGDADRNLRHSREVFDVAGEAGRIERVLPDVGELDAGLPAYEPAPGDGQLLGVVVLPVPGNAPIVARHIRNHAGA